MKYFKNLELAKIYHVSEKSVRNWIEGAENSKNKLELYEVGGRGLIANTTQNQLIIKDLVERGKKYKNSRGHKTISPSAKFYELYGKRQILDIMLSLDTHREIPLEYSYIDEGARFWDQYEQKLLREGGSNMLTQTINLLNQNYHHLTEFIHGTVSVVDLGVGNAYPVRQLLEKLEADNLLKKYIGIDLSQDMIDTALSNIKTWVNPDTILEGHTRNIAFDKFDDLLVNEAFGIEGHARTNIVLFCGGTFSNFRSPDHALQIINKSMGRDDLFVYITKLDSKNSRRYFDIDVEAPKRPLSLHFRVTLDLLNIDDSLYDVEQFYDKEKRARFVRVKLKIDLTIEFTIDGEPKHLELKKDDYILLWRYWHQNAVEIITQFDRNGFEVLQATKTADQEYLLTVSKIKTSI
jgi:uncharacterized SAM-dependent methyltransferase